MWSVQRSWRRSSLDGFPIGWGHVMLSCDILCDSSGLETVHIMNTFTASSDIAVLLAL